MIAGFAKITPHSLSNTTKGTGTISFFNNSYLRQDEEEIAKDYLQAMPNVSVYEVATPEITGLENENVKLKNRIKILDTRTSKFTGIEKENVDLKKRMEMMETRFEEFTKTVQELKKETLG